MRSCVADWVQEGRLIVWRYAVSSRNRRGWHFTADPPACRSIRSLLDRMDGGEPCYRTLGLERLTEEILAVPNFGDRIAGRFTRLRLHYVPALDELRLSPEGDILIMTVGQGRLRNLSAAFAAVETGGGDFGIAVSDERRADLWMFWWMLGIDYSSGRRR